MVLSKKLYKARATSFGKSPASAHSSYELFLIPLFV